MDGNIIFLIVINVMCYIKNIMLYNILLTIVIYLLDDWFNDTIPNEGLPVFWALSVQFENYNGSLGRKNYLEQKTEVLVL